jgi:hypothetical protein
MVGPGAPIGSNGTMYEERMAGMMMCEEGKTLGAKGDVLTQYIASTLLVLGR